MARPCTICRHAKRQQIDEALVTGEPSLSISRRFAVGADAVERHRKAHVPVALAKAQEAQETAYGDTLAEKVKTLEEHAHRLRAKAEKDGDIRAALAAVKILLDIVELLHRIQEETGPRKIEVVYAEDWRNPGEIEIQREMRA